MAAYHDRIKETKELLAKVTVLVLKRPNNIWLQSIFKNAIKQHKDALNNEPLI